MKGSRIEGECAAVYSRRILTEGIARACHPDFELMSGVGFTPVNGTEQSLREWFSVLTGIVNEYHDGGDQMGEECDCGRHTD